MNPPPIRLALLAAAALPATVSAQSFASDADGSKTFANHATTVLFGESNPDGLMQAPERRAVRPISAPYYHEDSFVTSDVRAWYAYHSFPGNSPIGGGQARVYAVQVRAALTDTLQLVAYKDGYIEFDSGAVDASGWNDLAAGLKWNFLQDWDQDLHASVGLGYELGIGHRKVLQDDDELRLWASVDKGLDRLHVGGTVNGLFAVGSEDPAGDADRLSWHLRGDYYVNETFSPVVEVNGYHVINEGSNTPLPFSGVDVVNLGGGSSEGVVTAALGGEFRVGDVGLRAAYESPLTDNEDLFGWRLTLSAVWGF